WEIGPQSFDLPILAAAMDGVVDPSFAVRFHRQGGLAVLNLEGLHGRYEDPAEVYAQIAAAPREEAATLLQDLYRATVQEEYVRRSVRKATAAGARLAVSATPANAERLLAAA